MKQSESSTRLAQYWQQWSLAIGLGLVLLGFGTFAYWYFQRGDLSWHMDDHQAIGRLGRTRAQIERVYSAAVQLERAESLGNRDAIAYAKGKLRDVFSDFVAQHESTRDELDRILGRSPEWPGWRDGQERLIGTLKQQVETMADSEFDSLSEVRQAVEKIEASKESYGGRVDAQVETIANLASAKLQTLEAEKSFLIGIAVVISLIGVFLVFHPVARRAIDAQAKLAHQHEELARRLRYETLVAGLARPFVDPDPDRFIDDCNQALLALATYAGARGAGLVRLDDSGQQLESITVVRTHPQAFIHRALDLPAAELPWMSRLRQIDGWQLVPGSREMLAEIAGIDISEIASRHYSVARLQIGDRILGIIGLGWVDEPDLELLKGEPMKVALSLFRGALSHQQIEETTRLVHQRIGLKPTHLARLSRKELITFLERSRRVDTIGSLASGIAHDFNNVLSAILLAVGDGQIGKHDPVVVEESLGRIQSAAMRARGLVGRILDFARTSDEPESKSDLGREVREALKISSGMLKGRALLDVDLPDEPIYVGLPPAVIHQIVLNLVTNASNALTDGGRIAVELHLTPEHDFAVLTVSDTGIGMSKEVQLQIFEPFFSGKEGGTGLGLAVVHAAVTDYGGRIEVESEQGVGTSFSVYLPTQGMYRVRPERIIVKE